MASRPTQFIMERAFGSLSLDWRALTVEVPAESFAVALAGMAAMSFRALRIYPSLSPAAAELLCSDECTTKYVGNATSAQLVDGKWACWDNHGFALLEWLAPRVDWRQTILCTERDTLVHRSLLAALQQTGLSPRAVAWRSDAMQLPHWLQNVDQQHLRPVESTWAVELRELLDGLPAGEEMRPTTLVCLMDELPPLDDLHAAGIERVYVLPIESTADRTLWQSHTKPAGLSVEVVRSNELLVEAEVYDFVRWTGHSIDRGLVRDAYDEFSDF